jgi:glycosyltransferase involved in cell wall biosynthesis
MINQKKIVVVMPAFNAAETIERTVGEIDRTVVDEIILVDDCSLDDTVAKAAAQGIFVHRHEENCGYGANQKSCYRIAMKQNADIVVMVHPDYQYDPRLVPAMAHMIASGAYDAVLGSRILGGGALKGGMPLYKYLSNRVLTAFQNLVTGRKLSEYHTGYRAFTRQVLETLPLEELSNDFVFDNQMLCQLFAFGFRIGEISCPARYFDEASSIDFKRSVAYGIGVIHSTCKLFIHNHVRRNNRLFGPSGRRLAP